MSSTKIRIKIDASALKESGCMRRFFLTVVRGYRAKVQTNDVEYGSAFHEFVKIMKENPGRYDLAIQAATDRFSVPMDIKEEKKYMTINHLLKTCMMYWEGPQAKDLFETLVHPVTNKPMVELKFSYPFYVDDEIEISLAGTLDDLCKHKHGTFALRDYKTSSVWKVAQYLASYRLSPQLLFYRLLIRYYARTYPDSIFDELDRKQLVGMVDGIFLRGANAPPEFKRSDMIFFSDTQIDEFECLVKKRIAEFVPYVKANLLPPREGMCNGSCQTVYGNCKFFVPCTQPDEISGQHMLNKLFIQRPYDPLTFGKEHENKTLVERCSSSEDAGVCSTVGTSPAEGH